MIALALVKEYMFLIGILKNNRTKKLHLIMNCIYFESASISFLSTFWFFAFTAKTFDEYVESFYYISCSLLMLAWYSNFLWQQNRSAQFFNKLDAIIEKRCRSTINQIFYQKTNDIVETLTAKSHFILMKIIAPFYVFFPFVLSLYMNVTSNKTSKKTFQLFYPATFPFNCSKPVGYLACALIEGQTVYCMGELFTIILIFTLGFSIFITDFVLDIEENLCQINNDLIGEEIKEPTDMEQVQMKEKLIDIILFHSEARALTSRFSDVISGIVFAYLIFACISFCSLYLQINSLITNENYVRILQVSGPAMVAVLWLFFFCHYGSRFTQRFEDIADDIYQISWYNLPLDLQENIPLMLAVAQKNVHLEGLFGTRCTREVFKKIINTTYSYFMVLRT